MLVIIWSIHRDSLIPRNCLRCTFDTVDSTDSITELHCSCEEQAAGLVDVLSACCNLMVYVHIFLLLVDKNRKLFSPFLSLSHIVRLGRLKCTFLMSLFGDWKQQEKWTFLSWVYLYSFSFSCPMVLQWWCTTHCCNANKRIADNQSKTIGWFDSGEKVRKMQGLILNVYGKCHALEAFLKRFIYASAWWKNPEHVAKKQRARYTISLCTYAK